MLECKLVNQELETLSENVTRSSASGFAFDFFCVV